MLCKAPFYYNGHVYTLELEVLDLHAVEELLFIVIYIEVDFVMESGKKENRYF